MKKSSLLLLFPALFAMALGGCNNNNENGEGGGEEPATAQKVTLLFGSNEGRVTINNFGDTLLGETVWNISGEGKYFANKQEAMQLGSSGSPERDLVFRTVMFKDAKVQSVTVVANGGNNYEGTVEVKLGENNMAIPESEEKTYAISNSVVEAKFVGDTTADSLEIEFKQPTSSVAVYLTSIEVEYTGDLYKPAATSIELTSNLSETDVGKKVLLDAKVLPEGADPTVEYVLSDGETTVATINKNEVTGVAEGVAKAKAKQGDLTSNEVSITFNALAECYSLDVKGTEANAITGYNVYSSSALTTPYSVDGTISCGGMNWTTKRMTGHENGEVLDYLFFNTKQNKNNFGSSDSAGVSYLANKTAFEKAVTKIEIDVTSGASGSAVYGVEIGTNEEVTTFSTTPTYTSVKGNNQTFTFEISETGIKYVAIGCTTTGYNGQTSAIRIFF